MVFESLFGIDPDISKRNQIHNEVDTRYQFFNEEFINPSESYFLDVKDLNHNAFSSILLKLGGLFLSNDESEEISQKVYSSCYHFIYNLSPQYLHKFSPENLYSTSYGTVIMEWEKDSDNIFSLEIGANEIGYFFEIDGELIKQVDSLELENVSGEINVDLSAFLFD